MIGRRQYLIRGPIESRWLQLIALTILLSSSICSADNLWGCSCRNVELNQAMDKGCFADRPFPSREAASAHAKKVCGQDCELNCKQYPFSTVPPDSQWNCSCDDQKDNYNCGGAHATTVEGAIAYAKKNCGNSCVASCGYYSPSDAARSMGTTPAFQ
jgi:hypothetical protein